jgi:hypothetical protein
VQVGIITIDGRQVGVVALTEGAAIDAFVPDLDGYVPQGRAAGRSPGEEHGAAHHHSPGVGRTHQRSGASVSDPYGPANSADVGRRGEGDTPRGERYEGGRGSPVHQGSAEVDQAITDASRAHHLDPNFMRSVASIESSMNPSSNASRATQYKGLYQVGRDEWDRFGEGNIYSARDNAFATGRMFDANRAQFRSHYGRDPTDTEMYLMHQQGLGFYTRGAMTNIGGNPYPGMHGPQTHETFEAGWGREVARRKAAFAARGGGQAEAAPADVTFDPQTMAP